MFIPVWVITGFASSFILTALFAALSWSCWCYWLAQFKKERHAHIDSLRQLQILETENDDYRSPQRKI